MGEGVPGAWGLSAAMPLGVAVGAEVPLAVPAIRGIPECIGQASRLRPIQGHPLTHAVHETHRLLHPHRSLPSSRLIARLVSRPNRLLATSAAAIRAVPPPAHCGRWPSGADRFPRRSRHQVCTPGSGTDERWCLPRVAFRCTWRPASFSTCVLWPRLVRRLMHAPSFVFLQANRGPELAAARRTGVLWSPACPKNLVASGQPQRLQVTPDVLRGLLAPTFTVYGSASVSPSTSSACTTSSSW